MMVDPNGSFAEAFRPDAVNWIELHCDADTTLYLPCVPAVMKPYLNPLGKVSGDARCATS